MMSDRKPSDVSDQKTARELEAVSQRTGIDFPQGTTGTDNFPPTTLVLTRRNAMLSTQGGK